MKAIRREGEKSFEQVYRNFHAHGAMLIATA
jgi:hypothetical protein